MKVLIAETEGGLQRPIRVSIGRGALRRLLEKTEPAVAKSKQQKRKANIRLQLPIGPRGRRHPVPFAIHSIIIPATPDDQEYRWDAVKGANWLQ